MSNNSNISGWGEKTAEPNSKDEVWSSIEKSMSIPNMIRRIEDLSGPETEIDGIDVEEIRLGLREMNEVYNGGDIQNIPDNLRRRVPDKIIERFIVLWKEKGSSDEDNSIIVA